MGVSEHPSLYRATGLTCPLTGGSVLSGLDWELRAGEVFGVLGPSGAGKTLFLKTLAGLVPYQGSLQFQGKELSAQSRSEKEEFRRTVSMTFQKDGLFDSMTCAGNLSFCLEQRLKLTSAERGERIEKALEEVGLGGQGGLWVHEMSGGMQKRLGIARALLFSPQVILYDEPAAGLDPVTARSILRLLCDMKERHRMTLVLVTSSLSEARQVCNRVGLLWRGKFEEQDDWDRMQSSRNPAVEQFFHARAEGPITGSDTRS